MAPLKLLPTWSLQALALAEGDFLSAPNSDIEAHDVCPSVTGVVGNALAYGAFLDGRESALSCDRSDHSRAESHPLLAREFLLV